MNDVDAIGDKIEADLVHARELAWKDIGNKATQDEQRWLRLPANLMLWRSALIEIMKMNEGSLARTPIIAKCQARLAVIRGLNGARREHESVELTALIKKHGPKNPPPEIKPAPKPVALPALEVNIEKALTEAIELLSGLDDLKTYAVRDRATQARRRIIELRIALRGSR